MKQIMAECCVHYETVKKQNFQSCQTKILAVPYLMQLFYIMKEDWFKFRKACLRDRYTIYITIKVVQSKGMHFLQYC